MTPSTSSRPGKTTGKGTMERLGIGEEVRWLLRIITAAGVGFGGFQLVGPGTAPAALSDHAALPGHPVMVERVQGDQASLQRLETMLGEVLRVQREHERLHHSGG